MTAATSPRQTRDVSFSPNSITPTSPKLFRTRKFRGSRRNGIWAKGDVTGLSRTSRGSRHSGIWANWAFVRRTVCVTVTSRSRQPCERMSAPVRYHRRRPAMVTKTMMITMMTKIVLQKSQPPISRRRQPTSETSA